MSYQFGGDWLQGLKPCLVQRFNVAAEAATHNDKFKYKFKGEFKSEFKSEFKGEFKGEFRIESKVKIKNQIKDGSNVVQK